MRGKRLVCLLTAAAAACLWPACAPVGPPDPDLRPRTSLIDLPAKDAKAGHELDLPVGGLRGRVEAAIENVRRRDLPTTFGFWTVFHGILGMGPQTQLFDRATGKHFNALDYICSGGKIKGMQFVRTPYGLDVATALTPDMTFLAQGHQDQFIAEMAQWGMPPDRVFVVDGKEYHFSDFVNQAKMRASLTRRGPDGKRQELSWTVLIVGQYVGTEAAWKNQDGEVLRLEDLLRYELDAPMDTAACGGTHRLFDLSWVCQLHRKRGGKDGRIWKDLAANAVKYQALAKRYQHGDGSFSTEFFGGPGDSRDPQKRINTTGHIFEWLALSLSDAQLGQPWVEAAADRLSQMILDVANQDMEGATLYHAVHGLIIYHARAFDRGELKGDLSALPLP